MVDRSEVGEITLRVAGERVSFDEAVAVAVGYCLGTRASLKASPDGAVGDPVGTLTLGAFAFDTYDQIPAAVGFNLEPVDVLVADGLNAQMLGRDVAGALAVADEVGDQIRQITVNRQAYWEIDRVDRRPEDEGHPAWPVWRAWTILSSVDGMAVARVHKILHHKRPRVFPLIDGKTLGPLGRGQAWATIRGDLDATPELWGRLEHVVNGHLVAHGKTPIFRLRLHDILLWTRVTSTDGESNRSLAMRKARAILKRA